MNLQNFKSNEFEADLINWFYENKRDLPWRRDRNPYKIWVSEVMLQQTRVDTVIPYFEHFIEQFPTLEALAYADEQKVLKAWEGLGYYSRVRNLQEAVREVCTTYNGQIPNTREEITKLKGVGPYTAGAILSIAFNQKEPAVDGNVMRVMSRILLIEDDISKAKTRKIFEQALYEIMSDKDPSAFNQGLMELGALVCTPTSPGCLLCPVRNHCRAYEAGMETKLPIKKGKTKVTFKELAALILYNDHHEVLIEKRPEQGLLANLWQFPNHETKELENQKTELKQYMHETYGLQIEMKEKVQTVEHTFSHLKWNITVYEAQVLSGVVNKENTRWVNHETIEDYPFPVSHQKIIARSCWRWIYN